MVRMLFFETPARPYKDVAQALGVATGSIGFLRMKCLDKLRSVVEEVRPVSVAVATRGYSPTRQRAQSLLEQSREQLRVDFNRSLALAQSALRLAEDLGDERLRALALRAAANALSVGGNNQSSIDHHTEAIAAFERVGDEPELARTLSACMQPLLLLGRYDEALEAADRARVLFANQGDELRLARLDNTIGNLFHRQDRFAEAMACYDRAHQALEQLGDADGVLHVIHNKAVTLTSLNDFREARAAYEDRSPTGCRSWARSGRRSGRLQHRVAPLPPRRIQPRDRDSSHGGRGERSAPATATTPHCRCSISRRSISS